MNAGNEQGVAVIHGERSRPGCGSARPRAEHFAEGQRNLLARARREEANDEGVVGCARGGRAPQTRSRCGSRESRSAGLY